MIHTGACVSENFLRGFCLHITSDQWKHTQRK